MKQIIPVLPKFKFGNPNCCAYCGDPPSGRDHVIPVSFQHLRKDQRNATNGPTTWACQPCNSKLGANWFDDFDDRCRWIRDRIDSAVKPVVWHDYELAKLDYGLRIYIKSESARRLWQRSRADWYESRDYWLNIENLQWQLAEFNPSNPGFLFLESYFRRTIQFLKEQLYKQ